MSLDRKFEFQYQYFNNLSNLQPFYGILDPSQENSIISLNRLKKHQDDITKYSIKHLTKSSYEQQYHNLEYDNDNIVGNLMDFHILIGIEKFDISIKKILVVKEVEGEDEDEKTGFRLGNDFLKDFGSEIEDVNDEKLLHRLKFTVQLKDVKGSKDNSNVQTSVTSIKNIKKNKKQSSNLSKNFNWYNIIIAFAIFLGFFIFKTGLFKSQPPVFEDKIKFLVELENEINELKISPSEIRQVERSIIDLTGNSSAIISSDIKILKNILNLQELMKKERISYENSLDYYGNTLWKLKEINIEKVLNNTSLIGQLFSYIYVNQKERINESDFDTYHSLLSRYFNKLINKNDLLQQITITEENLNKLQKKFETQSKEKDGRYTEFFEVVSRIFSDEFKSLQNIKVKMEKLKEISIVIGYIFMKLKDDIARILKDRNFNRGEYKQVSSYLDTIRYNRRKFLKNNKLSVK